MAIYMAISLFDLWFHLPIFSQPLALICTLTGAYILASLTLKKASWVWRHDYGAKYLIIILLMAGFLGAEGEARNRLLSSFRISVDYNSDNLKISTWVVPPDYVSTNTREINNLQTYDELASESNFITVPEGSYIKVRVEGAPRRPRLSNHVESKKLHLDAEGYTQSIQFNENSELILQLGGGNNIIWNINVEMDKPPTIAFTSTPKILTNNTLEVGYLSQDDYEIESANFHFRKFGADQEQVFTHTLATNRGQEGFENYYYLDLTSNPLAGSMVLGWLTVEDAIGQHNTSEVLQFQLPKRIFSNPVAQNIISIRRSLLLGPAPKEILSQRLKIQSESREEYNNDFVVYIALRTAYWRLNVSTPIDTKAIADLLWGAAIRLENKYLDQLALS